VSGSANGSNLDCEKDFHVSGSCGFSRNVTAGNIAISGGSSFGGDIEAKERVAVSGGMEVASNRLLKKMNKGVTVEQVTAAAQNLTEAGIMVHAYLMYGFPTETFQEIVEALGNVRDLFQQGALQSAFWHRYAMTVHSPSGKEPQT
jgi:thymidine phosphorylase